MSRKTRLRRRKRKRHTQQPHHPPGDASDYLDQLHDLLRRRPTSNLVLYCRVSTDKQEHGGNLDESIHESIRGLRALGCRLGGRLIAVFDGVESSHIDADRPILDQALAYARTHNAILVAPSRDRLLRHHGYDGTNQTEPPTDGEYRKLMNKAGGVPVATLLPPNTAARSKQTERGIKDKHAKVGRKPKSEQRKLLDAVLSTMKRLPH